VSIRCRREVLKPWAGGALLPLLLGVGVGLAAPARAQMVPPQIPRDGWKDGQSMTYREVSGKGRDTSGNRIFVPLRFPCKPPLKGEVGDCRY